MSKKTFLAALLALGVAPPCVAGTAGARPTATLRGAGSSFVAPLVALWAQNYKAAVDPVQRGRLRRRHRRDHRHQVDFGASDAPLTHDQHGACPCVQIPWALSGDLVAYNIPGASPGSTSPARFWRTSTSARSRSGTTPKIKKMNKGKTIPHVKITPVFRSDASGTTYNFTDYLSEVSKAFKNKVGSATQVELPTGIGARGSRVSPTRSSRPPAV